MYPSLLSTLPIREAALCGYRNLQPRRTYFYPRSPYGERLILWNWRWFQIDLSTHAPHARSDKPVPLQSQPLSHFYPRFPCQDISIAGFLSSLPMRGATMGPHKVSRGDRNFYPHSPCGERRWVSYYANNQRSLSTPTTLSGSSMVCPHLTALSS